VVCSDDREGLGPRRAATVRALMPHLLGLSGDDVDLVDAAVDRLDGFLESLPDRARADEFCQLIDAVGALSLSRYFSLPGGLSGRQLEDLVETLFDREMSFGEQLLTLGLSFRGSQPPSPWDLARSLRELLAVAFYSNPQADRITGFVPAYERESVLRVAPEEADAHPFTSADRTRLDVDAIIAKLESRPPKPSTGWFKNDGRPRVAIIGSGPGGAAAASQLTPHADVVIFEAGARFAAREFPYDTLAAMSLLYEGGLLTPTRDLDVRVLIPRAVGGGSVMNEGVSIRPRSSTLDHWQRHGAHFDRPGLERALDDVEVRQRFQPIADDLATSNGALWREGLLAMPTEVMVNPVLSDIATRASMHAGSPHADRRGDRCLACGLCNYGCRFGHHLTVDRTFLYDAESGGARIVENTRVERLVSRRDKETGQVRVTEIIVTHAGEREKIEVDHVVVAAGTPGSPALLLRSAEGGALSTIPAARGDLLGANFGFNVGSPAIARWAERPPRPSYLGVQTQYVATKPGDDTFILENGFIPPGVMASSIPGLGPTHRDWMASYPNIGMAVNTIGTPSNGRVDRNAQIAFRVEDGTLGILRETLATLVDAWLHAGAAEVRPAGVHPLGRVEAVFDQRFRGKETEILKVLERAAPLAEHLQIGSGHPQGGLAMNDDPHKGVVDGRFKVHGTTNLFVADASVFPTTIVVNLQWLVLGLGVLAGREIAAQIT